MRYVVTGGAGFIGSHIVEELVRQHHEVVVIDNLSSGKRENIASFLSQSTVTFVPGSITDLPLLKEHFSGADGVFHEAAIASVPRSVANPVETNDVNLTGTLNVLIAARDCGIKKVVFASSAAVYGDNPELPKRESMMPDPLSPYAVTKLAGENYCSVFSRLYGMQCVSLRYFNVFGPRQDPGSPYSGVITKFITNTLAHKPVTILGDGKQTRDFVYVKDVVRANIRAMESSVSGVFNVACGTQLDLIQLLEIIADVSGFRVAVEFAQAAAGDVRHSVADISVAKEMLGYAPGCSVREGLGEMVRWFGETNTDMRA